MSGSFRLTFNLRLVASDRRLERSPLSRYAHEVWEVNDELDFRVKPTTTIGTFKRDLSRLISPITDEDQRIYANELTLEQTKVTEELGDEIVISSLQKDTGEEELYLSLVIKPSPLSLESLKHKLPHIDPTLRDQLRTLLKSIPKDQLDVDSIRETFIILPSNRTGVTIRNSDGIALNELIINGQIFFPHSLDANSQQVTFRSKYSYQYSAASEEYIKEVKEANGKYESDLAHCKKLLHDLPIALANSQQKLAADRIKAVKDPLCEIELSDLGALLVEQTVIEQEIETQKKRLSQLKPIAFDKSKFIAKEFQSEISLSFGWHKFATTLYELIHTPMPTVAEINGLLQPNQHPVSVKRTRQQFESGQSD